MSVRILLLDPDRTTYVISILQTGASAAGDDRQGGNGGVMEGFNEPESRTKVSLPRLAIYDTGAIRQSLRKS